MSSLSAKNLKLDQNLPFLIISSTHLDLCHHVKILRCLKREGVWLRKFLSWIISLCDLEPSYCQLLEKGQATKSFWYESRSCHSKLLPGSLFKFLSSHIPIWRCCPKMSWRKDFSCLFKSKFLFDKFSSFCGLYPVLDLHSMVFKPLNLHVYPWKRLKLSKVDFGYLGKNQTIWFLWV
jgi:hypothetical protein